MRIEEHLTKLAADFTQSLIRVLVSAPIDEVNELARNGRAPSPPRQPAKAKSELTKGPKPTGKKAESSKRVRRSSKQLEELVERVVRAVEEHQKPEGVAMGELVKALRRSSAELTRPLHLALQAGRLKKTGDRRHTRYFPAS